LWRCADSTPGAYVPDATLLLATAASDTTAVTVQRMLGPVAQAAGQPLTVQDVVPTADSDPTGQGAFFHLVALSVGGCSAAIAIGASGARLRMRHRVAVGIGAAAVIAALATAIAGPLYGALPHSAPAIGALAWLYVSAVVLIGVGLHSFLRLPGPVDDAHPGDAVRHAERHLRRRGVHPRSAAGLLRSAAQLLGRASSRPAGGCSISPSWASAARSWSWRCGRWSASG
jgi:hypothetical protein